MREKEGFGGSNVEKSKALSGFGAVVAYEGYFP